MIRLAVLGQIDLRGADGVQLTAVLRQPKRLAILAYLASGQPGTVVRRERLLSMFWCDHPEDGARNALRQALHKLRAALGAEVIEARASDSIRIDETRLECDLWQFNAALRSGDLSRVLELYQGSLLPDFVVPDAPEFNEWLDAQRADVQRAAARACWALAEQQERAGRTSDAGHTARRAVDLLDDDEPALRQILMLLDRIDDSAGAVRAYQTYESRIRARLDVEPAAETKALVERIKAGNGIGVHGSASHWVRTDAHARPRIAIRAFENTAGAIDDAHITTFVAAACRQSLQDLRLVDVVNDDADDVTLVVGGDYHLASDRWQVRAFVQSVADSRTVGTVVCVEAPQARPWEAASRIAERIAAVVAAHIDPRVASWSHAVHAPPSVEAHQMHLRGMEEHLRGDFRRAIASFVHAASLQDRFTLPLLWAIQACLNIEEYEQAAALHDAVAGQRGHLSRAEQMGCDFFGALLAGDRGTAFRALQRVAELLPDSEVLAQLGREAMFINRPRLAAETLQRVGPDRGWMPEWTPYWRRLTEALHMTGDHAAERDAAERGRRQHPESVGVLLYAARAQAALGELAAVHEAVDSAVAMERDRFTTAADVAYAAAAELRAHGAAEQGRDLLRASIALQRDDCGRDAAAQTRVRLTQMLYEAAEFDQALAVLAECTLRDDAGVVGLEGRIHARTGKTDAAQQTMSALDATKRRYMFGRHLLEAARIAAILGDANGALARLRTAFVRGLPYCVELHTDIDLALLAGDARMRELLRPKG